MNRLRNHIIKNLSGLFLSIFISLFTIASVVFLIKLATYTAIIQLTTWEMIKLYLFIVSELLFYTLPISFFIASALTIFRLSNDNETVVIFALGIHPSFLIKTLLKPALLLGLILLLNFLVIIPHTTVLYKNFIHYKKSEAKFNLSASEFGHKFGNWLLYLGTENNDGTYSEVFLFDKNKEKETLISADKAYIINESVVVQLKLLDGEAYIYSKNNFKQIDFETMLLNNTSNAEHIMQQNALKYWGRDKKKRSNKKTSMLITNTLLSIFPIISLFLVLSMSIVHARHQKSRIYLYLFS
ncbi:MAG: LptF/LptG family permease [Sulfurimonas sp.]|nr:LptF/LptG family permease [Sulfurimonas sp.]